MSASDKTTSAMLKAALTKHFPLPGYRVFFEVGNDTGSAAGRRIDALAMGIWPSNGYEITGIEIKVSRSDLLRELKSPEKTQALMRFCHRWYLACPAGLVKQDELPATWGLLTYKDGAFRRAHQAPPLDPAPITPGFVAAILRNENGVDQDVVNALVEDRLERERSQREAFIERRVAERTATLDSYRKQVDEIGQRLQALTGEDPRRYGFDEEAFLATYRFFKLSGLHQAKLKGYGEDIPNVLHDLGKALASLTTIHGQFSSVRSQAEAREGV